MRLSVWSFCALLAVAPAAQAQSVMDNIPASAPEEADAPVIIPPPTSAAPTADTYTLTDVAADATADTAAHARDQALMQAERAAFTQLCTRLTVSEPKLDDDTLAALVQSFEVQSERVSAVRYIGVFTIRFKPSAVQKKMAKALSATAPEASPQADQPAKPVPPGVVAHIKAAVQTPSLPAWTQIKRRLNAVPQVTFVDTLDLGRGVSHIDLSYVGSIGELQQTLTAQGLVLRQGVGGWEIYDGSMVAR